MDKTNLRFDWIGKTTIQKQWHDLTRDELLMYVDWLENRLLKNRFIPNVVGRSEELLFSPDDIERIVDEKSMFNGKQFRKMFEK